MIGVEYFLEICDPYGAHMTTIMDFIELTIERQDKAIGKATVYLPGHYVDTIGILVPLLWKGLTYARHSQMRIWRMVDRGAAYLEGNCVWILTEPGQLYERNGELMMELTFSCWRWLLTTRKIAYNPEHDLSHHDDTDVREIALRWFRDAFMNVADNEPGRELQTAGYLASAAVAGGAGVVVSMEASYRDLLMTLVETMELADFYYVWMGFDFYGAGTGADFPWTFDVRLTQWGTDRRAGAVKPVVLSMMSGELTQVRAYYPYAQEFTVVYGLGPGEDDERLITSVTDATRVAGSPWGRIEGIQQAPDAENIDQVAAAAQMALQRGNPLREFVLAIEDTPRLKYGRDYFVGDLITIEVGGVLTAARIAGVSISVVDAKEVKRLSFEVVR